LKLRVGQGITGWVAERKEPVAISHNASEDVRFKFFNELPEDSYEAHTNGLASSQGLQVDMKTSQIGDVARGRAEFIRYDEKPPLLPYPIGKDGGLRTGEGSIQGRCPSAGQNCKL